jgi:Chlorophyll A-B binding protein
MMMLICLFSFVVKKDCFWDPLNILAGAPDQMKRNMQERELFNGRSAMIAFAVFLWEEQTTGKPLVSIEGNEVFFEPAYQIPFIQQWLDSQFSSTSPLFYNLPQDPA